MRIAGVTLGSLILLAACAGSPAPGTGQPGGDVEIVGPGSVRWPAGRAVGEPNFVWEYATTAWRGTPSDEFHQMKTLIRLRYDPTEMTFRWAEIESAGTGRALRHLCMTPAPDGRFTIRAVTQLDGRREDLTAVRIHGPDPATWTCEEYGIGPKDGLVEGLEVLFDPDGTFKVMAGRGAHLAGKGIHLHREMTCSPDQVARDQLDLP